MEANGFFSKFYGSYIGVAVDSFSFLQQNWTVFMFRQWRRTICITAVVDSHTLNYNGFRPSDVLNLSQRKVPPASESSDTIKKPRKYV